MSSFASKTEKIFFFFIHSTLALMVFELASSFSFYMMEISCLGLGVSFLLYLWCKFRFHPVKMIKAFFEMQKRTILFLILLAAYLVWDMVTILYSPMTGMAISKYKVIILMVLFAVSVIFYIRDHGKIDGLLWNIGFTGLFTALFTLANYLLLKIYPIYYTLRFTLRRDYNMYATVLFTALICLLFLILNSPWRLRKKAIFSTTTISILAPIIVLSSSRRIFILLFPTLLLFVVLYAIKAIKEKESRGQILATLAAMIAVSFLASAAIFIGMSNYMHNVYKTQGDTGHGGILGEIETAPAERYESISGGSLFDKRSIIWKAALRDMKTFSTKELLIGKGNAYDIHLYDVMEDAALDEAYPGRFETKGLLSAHCFLLADMLNGGIIKVLLGLSIWVYMGYLLLRFTFKYPFWGLCYDLLLGLVFINNIISNRFGYVYDKFFWIFAVLFLIEMELFLNGKRRLENKWKQ